MNKVKAVKKQKFILDSIGEENKDFFLRYLQKKNQNYSKKLKEINELEEKQKTEELKQEQLDKISRFEEFLGLKRELNGIVNMYLDAKKEDQGAPSLNERKVSQNSSTVPVVSASTTEEKKAEVRTEVVHVDNSSVIRRVLELHFVPNFFSQEQNRQEFLHHNSSFTDSSVNDLVNSAQNLFSFRTDSNNTTLGQQIDSSVKLIAANPALLDAAEKVASSSAFNKFVPHHAAVCHTTKHETKARVETVVSESPVVHTVVSSTASVGAPSSSVATSGTVTSVSAVAPSLHSTSQTNGRRTADDTQVEHVEEDDDSSRFQSENEDEKEKEKDDALKGTTTTPVVAPTATTAVSTGVVISSGSNSSPDAPQTGTRGNHPRVKRQYHERAPQNRETETKTEDDGWIVSGAKQTQPPKNSGRGQYPPRTGGDGTRRPPRKEGDERPFREKKEGVEYKQQREDGGEGYRKPNNNNSRVSEYVPKDQVEKQKD